MTVVFETKPDGDGVYTVVKQTTVDDDNDNKDDDGCGCGCGGCVIGCLIPILIALVLLVGIKFFWGLLWTI